MGDIISYFWRNRDPYKKRKTTLRIWKKHEKPSEGIESPIEVAQGDWAEQKMTTYEALNIFTCAELEQAVQDRDRRHWALKSSGREQ